MRRGWDAINRRRLRCVWAARRLGCSTWKDPENDPLSSGVSAGIVANGHFGRVHAARLRPAGGAAPGVRGSRTQSTAQSVPTLDARRGASGVRVENRTVVGEPGTLDRATERCWPLGGGEPQSFQDAFNALVSGVYSAMDGGERERLLPFVAGLRAAVHTSAAVDAPGSKSWMAVL